MQTATEKIKELEQEIVDLIDDNAKEISDLTKEHEDALEEKDDEIKELSDRVEELESMEYEMDLDTMTGKMGYNCENMNDNDTMQLFMELIQQVRPWDLQSDLKEIIKRRGVKTINVAA